jgi:RND family efflux transporter MFP subunit
MKISRLAKGVLALVLLLLPLVAAGLSEEKGPDAAKKKPAGPPPALVVVDAIEEGMVAPSALFVGTVYYAQVSDLSAEVEGQVQSVNYEEGRRVKKGQVLVRLSTELLEAKIQGVRASFEQAVAEYQKAKKDLERIENLYREETVSESLRDEHFFKTQSLEKKRDSLRAELERLEIEKRKKTIEAPFGGIILEKTVEPGEWVTGGGTVAVLADDSALDVLVDVPERILPYIQKGRSLEVHSGGRSLAGTVLTVIPKGDVATRSFTVKLRLAGKSGLLQGMEARVRIPTGPGSKGLVVLRDAVIEMFGQNIVFVVQEGKARMVPVSVTGYEGLVAGIEGPGLVAGMKAVIKGNERLRAGQPVTVAGQKGRSNG